MVSGLWSRILILIAAVVMLSSCDSNDLADRTLPEALDLPHITLALATTTAETPGTYNVEAFVTTRVTCSNAATCGQGFITISDIKGADTRTPGASHATFFLTEPTQFRKGDKYLFSIEITVDAISETREYELLGYDKL